MREPSIQCRECRFWLQSIEEDPERGSSLSDFGFCLQPGSMKWLIRTHKDRSCTHGELRTKELLAHEL